MSAVRPGVFRRKLPGRVAKHRMQIDESGELPLEDLPIDPVELHNFVLILETIPGIRTAQRRDAVEPHLDAALPHQSGNIFEPVDGVVELPLDPVDADQQKNPARRIGVKIRFQYFAWTVDKQMELKRDGGFYEVSPFLLSWDDENYYLIAYDAKAGIIKHFRVDKMLRISLCREAREGAEEFADFDVGAYTKKTFGMFAGEEEVVTLVCRNELIGVMIDRFGQEVSTRRRDEDSFFLRTKVAVSRQFFGWLTGLGDGVRIQAPEDVRQRYCRYLDRILEDYGKKSGDDDDGRKNFIS